MSKGLSCCDAAAMFGAACLDHAPRNYKPPRLVRKPAAKNLCFKIRPADKPYEVWAAGGWTWYVLKKWQADDDKPFARWFCRVVTPWSGPAGDFGDVYVVDVKRQASKIKGDDYATDRSATVPKEDDHA